VRFLKILLMAMLTFLVSFVSLGLVKAQQQLTQRVYELRSKAGELVMAGRSYNAALNLQMGWYVFCSNYPARCQKGEYAGANQYLINRQQILDKIAQAFREMSDALIAQIKFEKSQWENKMRVVCNNVNQLYNPPSCTDARIHISALDVEIDNVNKIIKWAYETR
jgi:hypothetical protein